MHCGVAAAYFVTLALNGTTTAVQEPFDAHTMGQHLKHFLEERRLCVSSYQHGTRLSAPRKEINVTIDANCTGSTSL